MEIDFLGLKSKQSQLTDYETGQTNGMDQVFTDDSGDEISLSLSTSSSLDSHMGTLGFHEKNVIWKLNYDAGIPARSSSKLHGSDNRALINGQHFLASAQTTSPFYPSSTTFYPYDLNHKPTNSRSISEFSTHFSSFTAVYSSSQETSENKIFNYMEECESTSLDARKGLRDGYTPTVAMARRATLARFLEKRLHRMTHMRTSGLVGKSSTSQPKFETRNMKFTKMRKKKCTSS